MLYCPSCMGENEDRTLRCRRCGGDMSLQNQPHQLPVMTILRGRYLVGRVLGQGGSGITYVGRDLTLGMKVAIKEYYPLNMVSRHTAASLDLCVQNGDLTVYEKEKFRFLREAEIMAKFKGEPNIVQILDFFYENNTAYIVMEYLDGQDLNNWLKEHGPETDFKKVYTMLRPVIQALGKVHQKGMIHRDVCLSNIMMDGAGEVKLLDFGTARDANPEGEETLTVVKPGYAPVEQYNSHEKQGPWTDVYALCATMYKLSTGQIPPNATDRATGTSLVPPSQLGVKIAPAQERALLKGLEVLPKDRIQTMDEQMEAFDRSEPSRREPDPAKPKKKKLMPIAAVLALAVGAFALFGAGQEIAPAPPQDMKIVCDHYHTVGLRPDGTVVATGMNDFGQCDVSDWTDIVDVDTGILHTVGLRSDGTVVTTEEYYTPVVAKWTDVVAISAGDWATVGLGSDGTVLACGANNYGECGVADWTDIVAVSAGLNYTVGLRSDGTVLAAGRNDFGQCDVSDWTDVEAIVAGAYHTVGLRSDGTVLAAGRNDSGQCDVSAWTDIVDVDIGYLYTLGLRADGTVVITQEYSAEAVSTWTDIVAIAAGNYDPVGLRADSTVLAYGADMYGECDVSDWTDIVAISAGLEYTVGLRSDGTVVAVGNNDYGQCDVSEW